MILFSLLGIPLFSLLIVSLYRIQRKERSLPGGVLCAAFLKGMLFFIPVIIITIFAGRITLFSFKPAGHYFYLTLQDHLLPYALIVVWFFILLKKYSTLQLILFTAGFYSFFSLFQVISLTGRFDIYKLFLIPVIRMAVLIYLPLLFVRYREWYGTYRVLFFSFIVLIPLTCGLISFLYMRFYIVPAMLIAGIFWVGSLIFMLFGKEH